MAEYRSENATGPINPPMGSGGDVVRPPADPERDARIKAYRARERARMVAALDRFLERMFDDPYGERPEWAALKLQEHPTRAWPMDTAGAYLFGVDAGPAWKHGAACEWPDVQCIGHAQPMAVGGDLANVPTNDDHPHAFRSHNGVSPLCWCGLEADDQRAAHTVNVPANDAVLYCPECNHPSMDVDVLREHIFRMHTTPGPTDTVWSGPPDHAGRGGLPLIPTETVGIHQKAHYGVPRGHTPECLARGDGMCGCGAWIGDRAVPRNPDYVASRCTHDGPSCERCDPCAGGRCVDPAAHAEGAHDL